MGTLRQRRAAGFTLTELLVVIIIIGMLAALITAAAAQALVQAREAAIKTELDNIALQLQDYNSTYGAYPPDFTDETILRRHLRKRFPRALQSEIDAIVALNLNRAEALVFWLQGFTADPVRPYTRGLGANALERKPLMDLDASRLQGTYPNMVLVPQPGDGPPYLYFDALTYDSAPGQNNIDDGIEMMPYRSDLAAEAYAEPRSFQIISAGLDHDYGKKPNGTYADDKSFPSGSKYRKGDRDNLVNFSQRNLEDSIP